MAKEKQRAIKAKKAPTQAEQQKVIGYLLNFKLNF